jgi:hypothetical protein
MAYLTPLWVPFKRVVKFPNVLKVYKRAGWGQGTGQGIPPIANSSALLSAPQGFETTVRNFFTHSGAESGLNLQVLQTLTGIATTGIAGQVSFTASTLPVVVGQTVKIAGALGGTGSFTGYSNPTSYLVGVTNGTTTATLTTLTGGAIVTVAGTITGATVTTAGLPSWLRKNPGSNGTANFGWSNSSDWQDCQVDITNIPGVRPMRKDGRWVGTQY